MMKRESDGSAVESAHLYRNKWLIFFTIALMVLMFCLDGTIVNVALPEISLALGASASQTEFVVFSYLFTSVSTILIFGRLGDVWGKTRIFKAGVIVFTLGSLLCGMCTTLVPLVLCRILQSLGASAALSTNLGIITQVFPSEQRGRALGVIGSTVAIGTMIGPAVGGFIVSIWSWEYIFLINIPIGLVASIMSLWVLRIKDDHVAQRMDIPGALMIFIVALSFCFIIVVGQAYGFISLPALIAGLCALALLVCFVLVEKRQEMPLIDVTIFSNKMLTVSFVCCFLLFMCNSTVSIIMPLYLENARGFGPDVAGLILALSPLIIVVLSPLCGYLSDKIGAKVLTAVGLCVCATGLGLMALLNGTSEISSILIATGVMSAGWALFQSPNNSLIMSFAPPERLGIIGGLTAFVRTSGMAIGVSVSTSLLFTVMSGRVGYPVSNYLPEQPDAFFFAFSVVFMVSCVVSVLGALLTIWRIVATRHKAS